MLGVTKPALTKSLHELEDLLQLRLFDRHARGVRATEAGLVFVQTARRILAQTSAARRGPRPALKPRRRQCRARGPSGGRRPSGRAGPAQGRLSGHKVQLQQGRTEDLLPLLASGEVDLIVRRLYAPAVPDGLAREALWTEPVSILARTEHPVFSDPVTVEALRRCDLVLPTVSQRVGQEIEHLLALLGLEPTASLRSSSYGFIREMLHATDLISVMRRLMMVGDLLRGTLKVVPLPIPAPGRAAGRAFSERLRAYVGEIAERGLAEMADSSAPQSPG